MSELINKRSSNTDFRWKLLGTASAVALLGALYGATDSSAADQTPDRPTVWIELGGQMDHIEGQGQSFPIGFLAANPTSPVLQPTTPLQAQRPVPFDFAEQGRISIQPSDSDWVFSAAVTFGRSSNFKHVDHQTQGIFYRSYTNGVARPGQNPHGTDDFADTQVHHRESHTILDFSAGKDVGLGLFGTGSVSTLSLGVRFAQLSSNATFDVRARPDLQFENLGSANKYVHLPYFHTYHSTGHALRSFHGIGPSLSWNSSTPLLGAAQSGEVSLDWGINASTLFGKQKAHVEHQEAGYYWSPLAAFHANVHSTVYQHSGGHDTDRSVVVPNVGGFAGATWRIEDFKASLGYRADFFFGAVDTGIDARKSETLGFYGPFATISVGLGG